MALTKIRPEEGLRGLPPKICICFLLKNYTQNSEETWLPPLSPVMYQRLLMTLEKSESKGELPPKIVFAFFSEITHTISMKHDHNLYHSWCAEVIHGMGKKPHRYLLSSPLHMLWVIHAYQWFPGYLIQPLSGERPGVLPRCFYSVYLSGSQRRLKIIPNRKLCFWGLNNKGHKQA